MKLKLCLLLLCINSSLVYTAATQPRSPFGAPDDSFRAMGDCKAVEDKIAMAQCVMFKRIYCCRPDLEFARSANQISSESLAEETHKETFNEYLKTMMGEGRPSLFSSGESYHVYNHRISNNSIFCSESFWHVVDEFRSDVCCLFIMIERLSREDVQKDIDTYIAIDDLGRIAPDNPHANKANAFIAAYIKHKYMVVEHSINSEIFAIKDPDAKALIDRFNRVNVGSSYKGAKKEKNNSHSE